MKNNHNICINNNTKYSTNNICKEILTFDHKIFYKCDEYLFEISNEQLNFYGFCQNSNNNNNANISDNVNNNSNNNNNNNNTSTNDNTTIIAKIGSISRNVFQHNYDIIMENMKQKRTILYYLKMNKISFHTRIFCETLAKDFNVFVIGWNLWNLCINNVYYIDLFSTYNLSNIHSFSHIFHAIFIEDCQFFLYFSRKQFVNAIGSDTKQTDKTQNDEITNDANNDKISNNNTEYDKISNNDTTKSNETTNDANNDKISNNDTENDKTTNNDAENDKTFKNGNIFYVYHYDNDPKITFQNVEFEDNGYNFTRNILHCIDQIWFYSTDDQQQFMAKMINNNDDSKDPNNYNNDDRKIPKIIQAKYVISDIIFKNNNILEQLFNTSTNKSKLNIICYDRYSNDIIKFVMFEQIIEKNEKSTLKFQQQFKQKCEQYEEKSEEKSDIICNNNHCKIIWFNNNRTTNDKISKLNKNITILPRNHINFLKCLQFSHIFFTSELNNYTHFNIEMALKCPNIICVIPIYFQQYLNNNRCIIFRDMPDLLNKKQLILSKLCV